MVREHEKQINSECLFEETEHVKAKWYTLDIKFPVFPFFLAEYFKSHKHFYLDIEILLIMKEKLQFWLNVRVRLKRI